jgi:hypothetical protein
VAGADLKQLYNSTRGQGLGQEVKRRILMGTYALSAGYYDAYYKRAQQVGVQHSLCGVRPRWYDCKLPASCLADMHMVLLVGGAIWWVVLFYPRGLACWHARDVHLQGLAMMRAG